MLSTSKTKSNLFLASSLFDGLEDNNLKQITILLENKKADPNVLSPSDGIAPFHLAVGSESESFAEKVTKLFLRHGGNPNVKSIDGMTPVHFAAAGGRVNILELLLANGGDPLCLDYNGCTPFQYASNNSYYNAITILEKYCAKNLDADDNEEDNKPKINIKLKKILVNRGNVIAEYVPSEIDLMNDAQYEIKENIVSIAESEGSLASDLRHEKQSSSKSKDIPISFSDEYPNFNDNVTYRRGQLHALKYNAMPKILTMGNFNFDDEKGNVVEKNFVEQLLGKNELKYTKVNELFSQLLEPNNFKNNIDLKEKATRSACFELSIISKSPNFKIPTKKINDQVITTPEQKVSSPNWTKKYFAHKKFDYSLEANRSLTSGASQINSINSTSIEKPNRRKYKLKKLFTSKEHDRGLTKTPLSQTSIDNNYDTSSSTDKDRNSNIAHRKQLYRNNARNLDNSIYNENGDTAANAKNIDDFRLEYVEKEFRYMDLFPKFAKLSDVDNKAIIGMTEAELTEQINHLKLNIEPITKSQVIETNIQKKYENGKAFLESPGSSRPISARCQYQSDKKESDLNEELEIHNEINTIYENKGRTPPASVSKLINSSSTNFNTSRSSTSTEEEKIILNSDKDEEKSNESSNTENNRTSMKLNISSRSSSDTFMSIDEEYVYIDTTKDVSFTERRLLVTPKIDMNQAMYESTWLSKYSELSNVTNQNSQRTSEEFYKIFNRGEFLVNNTSLRHQLIALGETPGPITDTTHYLYLKRLYKLKRKNMNLNESIMASQSQNEIPKSPIISKTLLSIDWITKLQFYRDLEELAFREYEIPKVRIYRGGMAKTSFNYLLLDPRITKDLPRKGRDLSLAERWKIFLKAIFYIGKGKNTRPFKHLYESHEIWTGHRRDDECNEKTQRILNIWRDGKGVICHQVYLNSMEEEAFTREAAMIDALGTKRLCNCQRGSYYGLAVTMTHEEKMALGKYLLYKAMEILMHDGERQQFPRNIE